MNMEIQKEENGTIHVSGSVTSDSAEEFREDLHKYAEGKELVLDCLELSYISSDGLREFVRLMKQGKVLSLLNVNSSVYETLVMTGLADHIHVERALRKVSVEGLPLIGEGITASVYRLDDDKVIKVYRPGISRKIIEQEYEITRQGCEPLVF